MRDVSFAIAPGELVAVLGPSGCGKTTILNIVAGFLAPTEGGAFIGGREIPAQVPIAALSSRRRLCSTG